MKEIKRTESLKELQAFLTRHHGGDGEKAAKKTLENHQRHHDEEFWSFWNHHSSHLTSNASLVDAGCGIGLFLAEISVTQPNWRCFGIEGAPYMLERMVKLPETVTILVDDLNQPSVPIEQGSVDIVVANMLIHELHQPVIFLQQVEKWLSDTGVLILIDMVRQPLSSYLQHGYADFLSYPRDKQEDTFQHFLEHNRYTADDLRFLLESCGFKIQEEQSIKKGRAVRFAACKS